jgi:predicted dehydrogenase
VASRSQARADAFAKTWGIPRRYNSYEALANDENVDVIYIATPHSHHAANMQQCLNAGKHVLCEKAFTLNAREAVACIELARQKGLFLMEAMWMRFFPAMAQVRQWLAEGVIGEVKLVQADFFIKRPFDPQHRLYNPDLGGGALLDLGIYPLSLATMVLGTPDHIDGHAHLSETAVDQQDTIILSYDSGATAVLGCGLTLYKPHEALIVGTEGAIKVHDIFFKPNQLTLHLKDQAPVTSQHPFRSNGLIHEVEAVHAALRAGKTESPLMTWADSLMHMRLMDTLRAKWGVVYAADNSDK